MLNTSTEYSVYRHLKNKLIVSKFFVKNSATNECSKLLNVPKVNKFVEIWSKFNTLIV